MADDSFHRQRRNLLVVSSIVIFLGLTGGSIEEINVLGTKLFFRNPDSVLTAFLCLLAYLLIRYLQYCPELNGSDFRRRMAEGVQSAGDRIVKRIGPIQFPELLNYDIVEYGCIRRDSHGLLYRADVRVPRDEDEDEQILENINKREIRVTSSRLLPARLYTILYIVIRTPWFTEYVIPLVLAVVALWVAFHPAPGVFQVAP